MDLKQLRYIVQIIDTGSISRAAQLLHVAQPSLSQQLRSVEEELGLKLLVRHPRGVKPTEDGKIFVQHARRIIREMDRIQEVMASTSTNPSGRVTVGIPTSACRGLSVPLIHAAAKRLPNISLHITEAMTGNLDDWIDSGKLDVALLYNHKAYENVAWTEMMSEDLMVIAAADSEIGRKPFLRFSDLRDIPLVLPGRPNVLRNVLELVCARLDMEVEVRLDCDTLSGMIELVKAGYVTVLPHFAVLDGISAGQLRAVPLVDPTPSWRLSVVLSRRTSNTFGSQAVAQLMAETIRDLVETDHWRARLNFGDRVVPAPAVGSAADAPVQTARTVERPQDSSFSSSSCSERARHDISDARIRAQQKPAIRVMEPPCKLLLSTKATAQG